MKRRLAVVAIAMLVAVLAAGCGGDDDDGGAASTATATTTNGAATTSGGGDDASTDAPPSAGKAQFITRADAICKATESKIGAAATKLRTDATPSGTLSKDRVATFFTSVSVPAYERMIGQLRDVTPPQGDEQAIDGFVSALAKAVSTVKANPKKYASREVADPFATANKRARDYGLKACGS